MSEWPAAENDKKCLLVIDDDQTLRDSLRMILQSSFHVLTVESVDSAAELLKSGQPDAIILDLNMPEKDGLQGLREIHPSHPEVPILMLTGYADNQTIEEALNLGAAGIMGKNF
ncbi:MAG: response regulator [Verrucomicrobiales bacterium]